TFSRSSSDETGSSSAPPRIDRGTHIPQRPSRWSASTTGSASRPSLSLQSAYSSAIDATVFERATRPGPVTVTLMTSYSCRNCKEEICHKRHKTSVLFIFQKAYPCRSLSTRSPPIVRRGARAKRGRGGSERNHPACSDFVLAATPPNLGGELVGCPT